MLEIHKPVLVNEIINIFSGKNISVFIDGTLGAGGHAKLLLEKCLKKNAVYIGFDQDSEILEIAKQNLKEYKDRIYFINKNFSEMKNELNKLKIKKVDGILLDLGVSSLQFDSKERGFGFKHDSLLDMRMDLRNELTAYDVINGYTKEDLLRVFYENSDIARPKDYVRKIMEKRSVAPIKTTQELANIFSDNNNYNGYKRKKIHPATQVFQAIRIEVNNELKALQKGLIEGFSILNEGGHFAVISFHSLEDRIVKNFFREESSDCNCPKTLPECVCGKRSGCIILTKKPLSPQENEITENPRSRSAKLRVICKL